MRLSVMQHSEDEPPEPGVPLGTSVRAVEPPALARPASDAAARLRLTWTDERERTMRTRLDVTVGLWLVCSGLVTLAERHYFPAHAATAGQSWGIDAGVSLLAALAAHRGRPPLGPTAIATALLAYLVARVTWYSVAVGSDRELVAMAHITVLGGVAVLLPWGWPSQLAVAITALGTFVLAVPRLSATSHLLYSLVPLGSAAACTVLGASFVDRYRFAAFRRTALEVEEAEIASTLLRVAETLSSHFDQPDLLERVNRLALETLGGDWSGLWVLDPTRTVFRLAACAGVPADLRAELAELEFGDQAPMVRALRPGVVIGVPDAAAQSLVPPHVTRRFAVASALIVPIARAGHVTGILVHCHRRRTGGFSLRQRRVALGLAHATAIAQENARLITDLQAASRLKSTFVSTMSHELRTPVNVISGYADLLRDGTFDPLTPAQHEVVGKIRHQAVELLALIDATLDLGRLETGRETVSVGSIDLEGLLDELRRELEPLAAPGVDVRCTCVPRATRGDRTKVKTILRNLMGNALKFTARGTVDVTASTADGQLTLVVRDTGIGIAHEDLPLIFEMFRQVDGASTGRFGGVGLGLHIVSHLVELLRGTIAVESTPGVGSTFTVRLPVPV